MAVEVENDKVLQDWFENIDDKFARNINPVCVQLKQDNRFSTLGCGSHILSMNVPWFAT